MSARGLGAETAWWVGKVAVVTGGSHGIGLAVVSALAGVGARVVTGARSTSAELETLLAADDVTFVPVDLTDAAAPAALVSAAGERVDLLINNVGTSTPRPAGFTSVTDADWSESFDLNVMAAVRAMRSAVMRMRPGSAIVNVTSDNARLPDPRLVDYGAAKAALASVTKALAVELAPRGIRVNAVSPGPARTRRWATDEARHAAAARMPTGRLTTPHEVAAAVMMLAGPDSTNTTGATWTVDGGLIPVV